MIWKPAKSRRQELVANIGLDRFLTGKAVFVCAFQLIGCFFHLYSKYLYNFRFYGIFCGILLNFKRFYRAIFSTHPLRLSHHMPCALTDLFIPGGRPVTSVRPTFALVCSATCFFLTLPLPFSVFYRYIPLPMQKRCAP